MIKSSGYRISNADLEHKLSYLNSLIECRIVGLEDPILGEKIALFIYSLDKDIVEKIKLFVSDWPIYMRPHYVIKMNEEFLLNTNGKVDDKLLRSEMGRGEVILRLSLK